MNGYIQTIISRHVEPGLNISPRLPGIFETQFSQPVSLPESYPIAISEHNEPIEDGNQLSVKDTIRKQTANTTKTEKSFLYDTEPDHYQTGEKPDPGQILNAESSRPSYTDRVLNDNPVNIQEFFSSAPLAVKTEARQAKQENKTGPFITGDEKQVMNFPEQEILQPDANTDRFKEPYSFTESRINALIPDEEKLQYNNALLISAPAYSVVLPKENATAPLINYHEGTSVIKVSIGRIEVRAIAVGSPPLKSSGEKSPSPKMSLADYLKKRNGPEQ